MTKGIRKRKLYNICVRQLIYYIVRCHVNISCVAERKVYPVSNIFPSNFQHVIFGDGGVATATVFPLLLSLPRLPTQNAVQYKNVSFPLFAARFFHLQRQFCVQFTSCNQSYLISEREH